MMPRLILDPYYMRTKRKELEDSKKFIRDIDKEIRKLKIMFK
jgi:hypothetical protein